jgi:hypothetical protein
MSEREKTSVTAPGTELSCPGREPEDTPHVASTAPELPGHILRKILCRHIDLYRCPDAGERNVLQFRIDEMRNEAEKAFAALNGWHFNYGTFPASRIGKANGYTGADIVERDHCLHFHEPTRPYRRVALVTQPYNRVIDEVTESAARLGLVTHLPPSGPWASIHFPGSTLFIVVTKPGTKVRWLPEQECSAWFDERLKLERALLQERTAAGQS